MELIERYLFEVGRHLPARHHNVLPELRSSLEDAVEARAGEMSRAAAELAVLEEMGPPRALAASYYPEGQYLIGPALYPFFRLALGITLTAAVGAQLLVVLLSLVIGGESLAIQQGFWEILGTLPMTLGMVVIVFALLQRSGVVPSHRQAVWDPRSLAPLHHAEPVERNELLFELLLNTAILVWLARFVYGQGFGSDATLPLLQNPVVEHYLPWIALAMVVGILLDGVLLWQGRWQRATRLAKLAVNSFGIVVLVLVLQGHQSWLTERGLGDLRAGISYLPASVLSDGQLLGMLVFRIIFAVALVADLVETAVHLFRLLRGRPHRGGAPLAGQPGS